LKNLLARTMIFGTDEEAAAAASQYRGSGVVICVSQAGLLISSEGSVRGGRGESQASSLLGRKEKLDEIEADIVVADKNISGVQDKVEANRTKREEIREGLSTGRGRLNEMDEVISGLAVEMGNLEHRRETSGVRAEEMENERVRLAAEVKTLAQEETNLTDQLTESGKARENSTIRREDLRKQVEDAEATRDDARSETEELRLTHHRRESQQRETETALIHLRENISEQVSRGERLAQDAEVAEGTKQSLISELEEKRQAMANGVDERERRRQVVRAATDGIAALHEETSKWHERVQIIEKARGGFREQAHEMETLLATLDIKRNNLEERIEEQYKGSFKELLASFVREELPSELEWDEGVFQISQADELLVDKRRKINSLEIGRAHV